MPTNQVRVGLILLFFAGCSSRSRSYGLDDGGSAARGGSAGTFAAAGSGGTGAPDAGGSGGQGASAGSAGTGGTGGSGGTSVADGSAGTGGGCVATDASVDFTVQGNQARESFAQEGVSLLAIADLKFSDRTAEEPNAGLGVVGGWFDWSIDSTEFVSFTFTKPATNVKYEVTHALDIDQNGVFGASTVTAYDAAGREIDRFDVAGPGSKNVSALFGGVPIAKFMVKSDTDGIAVGTLSFTACPE